MGNVFNLKTFQMTGLNEIAKRDSVNYTEKVTYKNYMKGDNM